jgi:putative hydrolase of the HAD superfamily
MIKALILDADGVVINKKHSFSKKMAEDLEVPMQEILPFFENEFVPCVLGKADLKEEVQKYFAKWKWQKSVEEFLKFWFQTEHSIDNQLINRVSNLKNQGIQLFLASNQERYRADYITHDMEFEKVFNKMFFSCQLGYAKPQREFWECVYNHMGDIPKNQILFWDDDAENVESAKEFGFHAELYKNFPEFESIMASKYA